MKILTLMTGLLLSIACFFLYGCGSDQGFFPTPNPPQTVGWAIGVTQDKTAPAVFKTVDGVTWTRILSDKFTGSEGRNVSAVDNLCAWLSITSKDVPAKVLRTLDGGITWEDKSPPENKGSLINIKAISRDVVWAAGDGYLAITTNGGGKWDSMTPSGHPATISYNYVDALDQQHVWAVGTGKDSNGNDQAVVVRTLDGVSWETMPPIPKEIIILGLAVTAPNTVRITTQGNGNFYTSYDGGATWGNPVNILIADLNNVAVFGTTVWTVADHGLFCVSTNGGISFDKQKLPGNYADMWVLGISALDDKRIWVGGSAGGNSSLGGLLWTIDGGKTWHEPTPSLYGYDIWRISFVGGVK